MYNFLTQPLMAIIATGLEGPDSGTKNIIRKEQQLVHMAMAPDAVWWLVPRNPLRARGD